jgi:hypothetical protein
MRGRGWQDIHDMLAICTPFRRQVRYHSFLPYKLPLASLDLDNQHALSVTHPRVRVFGPYRTRPHNPFILCKVSVHVLHSVHDY